VLGRVRGVTSFRVEEVMSCLSLYVFFSRWKTLPFIVQGRLHYIGAKGVRIERKNSRPRRSGSSALSVGSSHPVSRSLLVTTVQVQCRGASVLSCPCPSCSIGQGGEPVLRGTARQSHLVPSAMPCHSIMMEACPPCHDVVVPRLFARMGR
jgi:hypothetical protein